MAKKFKRFTPASILRENPNMTAEEASEMAKKLNMEVDFAGTPAEVKQAADVPRSHHKKPTSTESKLEAEKAYTETLWKMQPQVLALGAAANRDDADDLRKRFLNYMRLCRDYNLNMTYGWAIMSMGLDEVTADEWFRGSSGNKEQQELIRWVIQILNAIREQLLEDGKVGSVAAIWIDKTRGKVVEPQAEKAPPMAPPDAMERSSLSAASIAEKYANLIDDDIDGLLNIEENKSQNKEEK